MTFNLHDYINEKQTLVNQYLGLVFQLFDPQRELIRAINHSLMSGGKRLRPILCLASAQACGRDPMPALPASCAIEMIHTYSLIHDDLPGMDDDDLRRGVPTCHKKFSQATAILAGDALLTHAFHVVAQPENIFDACPDMQTRLELVGLISRAAGIQGMVEGQMLDMQANGRQDLGHLKRIHGLKTGKMIRASVEAGAISVGTTTETIEKLGGYADKIGLAFQVVDDILNVEGDPAIMGKAAGSDAINEKMTFPAVIGLEASRKYAQQLVDSAIESIAQFDDTATPLRAIASYVMTRDH